MHNVHRGHFHSQLRIMGGDEFNFGQNECTHVLDHIVAVLILGHLHHAAKNLIHHHGLQDRGGGQHVRWGGQSSWVKAVREGGGGRCLYDQRLHHWAPVH